MRVFVVHDEQGEISSVVVPEPEFASDLEFGSPNGTVIELSIDDVDDAEPLSHAVTPRELMVVIHTKYRVDQQAGKLVRKQ